MSGVSGEAALDFPLLSLLLWMPLLIGIPTVLLTQTRGLQALSAFGATVVQLAFTIIVVITFNTDFNPELAYQHGEVAEWIPALGITYKLGIDGISILMVLLTGILGPIVVATSWRTIKHRTREFYLSLILLQTGMMGVFITLDFILFYVFWEMMLIPMYFLIALWGHEENDRSTNTAAAVKFFIYTQTSGLAMLAAIIGLVS